MTRYRLDQAQYKCEWFTDWFRKTLGRKRITIDQLAKETGIGETTLHYYLNGVRSPSLKSLLLIVDATGQEITIKDK